MNNKGIWAIIILLAVAILLVLGGIWYSSKNNASDHTPPQGQLVSANDTSRGNTVSIKELGITISVPDIVKDLTYVTSSFEGQSANGIMASFSTETFARIDGQCAASGSAAPLGSLVRMEGQYPAGPSIAAGGTLIKQFPGFYITYIHPQAPCWTTQQGQSYADSLPSNLFTSSTIEGL